MSQPPRKVEWAVWGGLGVIVLAIVAAFIATQFKAKTLPAYGMMPAFTLTNQNGQTVTLDTLRGQVWIADTIFTRCPGQCLTLSGHMKEIQDKLPPDTSIRLVSLSTDPAFDQPPVLKKYGEHFAAQDNRWTFLTGDKSTLHAVEVDGLKLPVLDKPVNQQESATDLFIHSEKFVLIDKTGRIRGYYDGQEETAVPQVMADAQTLARE